MASKKYTYQVVLVFNSSATDKQKEEVLGKIETLISNSNASLTQKDHLGTKLLVYKIKNESSGDFWDLTMEAQKPVKVRDLNIFLNREGCIIRYLVLKK